MIKDSNIYNYLIVMSQKLKTIILHFGFGKCGTTTMQEYLKYLPIGIIAKPYDYRFTNPTYNFISSFFTKVNKNKSNNEKKFIKFLETKMRENNNLIFSDEEVFAEYNKNKILLIEKLKASILKISKKNNYKIIFKNIITIRNPKDYIKSLYYFRQLNYLNYQFKDFIYKLEHNTIFRRENSFIYWINSIEKIYGNKFLFLPLENINKKEYMLQLSKYCNVKPKKFPSIKYNINSLKIKDEKFYFINSKKNIFFRINFFLKKYKFYNKIIFSNLYLSLKYIIRKKFHLSLKKEKVKSNNFHDKKIINLFINDIKYLEKKYKVNFKKLGYY